MSDKLNVDEEEVAGMLTEMDVREVGSLETGDIVYNPFIKDINSEYCIDVVFDTDDSIFMSSTFIVTDMITLGFRHIVQLFTGIMFVMPNNTPCFTRIDVEMSHTFYTTTGVMKSLREKTGRAINPGGWGRIDK